MTRRGCMVTLLAGLVVPGRVWAAATRGAGLRARPDHTAGRGQRGVHDLRVLRDGWILAPDDIRCVRHTDDIRRVRHADDA